MRYPQLLVLALLATAAYGDTCPTGTVAQIANSSCTIGDLLFDFGSASVLTSGSFTTPFITPGDVDFSPNPNPLNPGFTLTVNGTFFATVGEMAAGQLNWDVTNIQVIGENVMASLSVTLQGSTDQGHLFADFPPASVATIGPFFFGSLTDTEPVAPTMSLGPISLSFGLDADSTTGCCGGAELDHVAYSVNEVPEPTSLILLATGLVGISWFSWRRHAH